MNARPLFPRTRGKRYRLLRRPPESIRPSSPRPVRRDCHGRLTAALLVLAGPDDSAVEDSSLTPWSSATFIGARHGITLRLTGPGAATRAGALTESLPDADFRLPGHIVADVATESVTTTDDDGSALLVLSILTIEAW